MQHQIKKTISLVLMVFFFASLITSCNKDDDNDSNSLPSTGTTLKTAVIGTIIDTDNKVVSGVTVTLGTNTTITDARGHFKFLNKDVPKDRLVVIAEKDGFFNSVKGKRTQNGGVNYLRLMIEAKPTAINISGNTGGVVNLTGGAKITFPANAFAEENGTAYTGNVKVFARHINPESNTFEKIVPGGDLMAVDADGNVKILYSLGMIDVIITDNSGVNELKIATGKTAELKFPIAASQTSSALNTIPLWSLNKTTGIWKEEGMATKSGNFFIGNVSHFSTWNCDYKGERTDITGKVVDCVGLPIPNCNVTINGFFEITTDNNGNYSTWVPSGYTITCQALMANNIGFFADSPVQTIIAVSGFLNVVPTITILTCPVRLSGYVKSCSGSEPVPAIISISWNGGSYMFYTGTGFYSIIVPEQTNINIYASDLNYYSQTSFLSGITGSITSLPDLIMCNNAPMDKSGFTVISNGVTKAYVLIPISFANNFVDANSDGVFESVSSIITGYVVPGLDTCTVQISLNNESGGYFSLLHTATSSVFITIDNVGVYANGNHGNATQNKLTITDYSVPGGIMTANFEFDHQNGIVTNGKFAIPR